MRFADRIRRLWRGRGNGVHSPFAYRFITEVLHQHEGYYAYDELESDAERMAYRVALSVSPQRVTLRHGDEALQRALDLGHSHGLPRDRQPEISGAEMAVKGASFAGDVAEMRRRLDAEGCGMLFEGLSAAVAIRSPRLPRTDYMIDI